MAERTVRVIGSQLQMRLWAMGTVVSSVVVLASTGVVHGAASLVSAAGCCALGRRWRAGAVDSSDVAVWPAFARAARVTGWGIAVSAGIDVLVRLHLLGADAAVGAAGVVGALAATWLYHAITIWNPVRSDHSDTGDWVNGFCSVLVLAVLVGLTVNATGAPMTDWALAPRSLWVGTVATALILAGSAATVASLAGRAEATQLRFIALTAVAAAGSEVGLGVWGGARLATSGTEVSMVVIVAGAAWVSRTAPTGAARAGVTSQSATVGALVVACAGALTLAVVAVSNNAPLGAVLLTSVAVVGSGFRLLQLIGSLEHLAASRREARTDDLTGIGNRRALTTSLQTLERSARAASLLVIDLDRFKEINDRYGHAVGDEVLIEMARRICDLVSSPSLLVRQGGDEFAVLLPGATLEQGVDLAGRIVCSCVEPVITTTGPRVLDVSVGAAATTGDLEPEELVRRADAAMYAAKKAGGGVQAYDVQTDQQAREERARVDELRVLLGSDRTPSHDQVEVYFQPVHDVASGRVVGAEALVRWKHPTLGLLSPAAFLGLVERHGLMEGLTLVVLNQGLAAARRWREANFDLRLSVNLSASCLANPGLPAAIDAALGYAGVPPDLLMLEITETTLMHDPKRARAAMTALAEMGVELSIDDYGTGYSSLTYLSDIPARELKVDRSFTSRLVDDPRTEAIVASTIDLAHALGMHVVAEGVEDESTLAVLRTLGCDTTQGYFHARPMAASAFATYLAAHPTGRESVAGTDRMSGPTLTGD